LRVADVHAEAGKVAGSPGRRSHRDGTAAARALNDPLIVNEEEKLILHDRAAQRAPEDVLAQFRFGDLRHSAAQGFGAVVSPQFRVERVVAEKFKDVAMKIVRT